MQLQRLAELAADAMHRVEAARRVLEDHGDAFAAHALEQARRRSDKLLAFQAHRAAGAGARPRAASQVTLLPEPDSPTMPSASPGAIARSTPSTARERPSFPKPTVSPAISTRGEGIAASVGGEVDGAELHREGGRGLPADVLALGGEGRVLVQHGVG